MASASSVVPGMTLVAYTCSKHAMVGRMRRAAAELGQFGVRVNSVSPHALATPLAAAAAFDMGGEELEFMHEQTILKGVRLRPEDVAEALVLLGSEEPGTRSAVNHLADGGFTTTNLSHGLLRYSDISE